MKAYLMEGINNAKIAEVPIPTPKDNEVVIKVMATGLCGTDVKILKGEFDAKPPVVEGHEFSGKVEKVGKNVKRFKAGQRVTADPNIFCEKCDFCKENAQNFCEDFIGVGGAIDGAFAQYVAVPEATVFDIGELDYEVAAFAEPLSCVVHGQQQARPNLGAHVLIFGAGAIGLLHLQVAKHNGAAYAAVVDVRQERLAIAQKLGADFTYLSDNDLPDVIAKDFPKGFNMVIDTTGVPKVVENAINYVRTTGSLLIFGVCPPQSSIQINPYEIYRRELKIIGSFALRKTMQAAINLLNAKTVKVDALIGQRITLEELPDAVERFSAGKTDMKVIIKPNN